MGRSSGNCVFGYDPPRIWGQQAAGRPTSTSPLRSNSPYFADVVLFASELAPSKLRRQQGLSAFSAHRRPVRQCSSNFPTSSECPCRGENIHHPERQEEKT